MADFADKRDAQSLPDIVEQTKENLQSEGIDVEEVLADTHYSSGESLKYLEDNKITGLDIKEGLSELPPKRYLCEGTSRYIMIKRDSISSGK